MKIVAFLLILFTLAGCAQNISPNTYTTSEVGVVSKVLKGTILSRRVVDIDNNSGFGGATGMAAGAAAGAALGQNATTAILGGIGGAVVGGVAGSTVDKAIHQKKGYEYIIQLEDGKTVSVVQTKQVEFDLNQKVMILYGAMTRIVPDETSFHG